MAQKQTLYNWGLYPAHPAKVFTPRYVEELIAFIKANQAITPRGNGRSYGDSSLGDTVLSSLQLNRILHFDASKGTLRCEAGILLDDILQLIVPHGFFLPVSPGTRFITLGGALASDIHGKNHHVDGVFSDHVISFSMIDEKGEQREIYPGDPLFEQTAGGMGLTGFIYAISFKLKPVETAFLRVTNYKASNLKTVFDLFEQNLDASYSVAWIDCLASGNKLGRSILMLGEHAPADEVSHKDRLKVHANPRLNIPFFFPSWALKNWGVKAFNTLYYNKPGVKHGKAQIVHYGPYFYPLDAIHNWNRIYGKRGFTQYQCVLPKAVSYEGISRMLELMQSYKRASFLAVLKLFGKSHEDRFLHFPQEGYTLAVDFQVDEKTFAMLDEFDRIVLELGGKVYLTKDARMSQETFDKMYPEPPPHVDGFTSSQVQRLGL